jgi:hypothetical protein
MECGFPMGLCIAFGSLAFKHEAMTRCTLLHQVN